jgi:hypothetical protein
MLIINKIKSLRPITYIYYTLETILSVCRGIIMPKYGGAYKWNGYKIRIFPYEYDIFRTILGSIVPYFWDSDIKLDMAIDPPKNYNKKTDILIQYKWELRDADDKVVKSGQDNYETKRAYRRKHHSIKIGFLKPQQCYRLFLCFADYKNSFSEPISKTSLTIKDRDEMYMQIFIALIAVVLAIVIGFVAKGC